MSFLDDIFSLVWDIAERFLWISYEVKDIIGVGSILRSLFLSLHYIFWALLTPIAQFSDWVRDTSDKVKEILTIENVWTTFRQWFEWAEMAALWVTDAWQIVLSWVDDWWRIAQQEVLSWVNEAKQFAQSLIVNLELPLGNLQDSWNNFTTAILPDLVTVSSVSNLLHSTLLTWFPFYNEFVSLWSEIQEFFTDSPQYIYNKLDEWFERFW